MSLENDMYKFLVEDENFNNMVKLRDYYAKVHRRLIQEFWDKVKESLRALTKDSVWEIYEEEDQDYFERWSSMSLYKPKWYNKEAEKEDGIPLCIAWESLNLNTYYGVWINNHSKLWDIASMRDYLKQLPQAKNFKSDNHCWPLFGEELDFTNPDGLRQILPGSRDQRAKEYATLVYDLANELEAHLDKLFKMKS
ncbi:MAG: hypothetical protein COB85_08210 [Bacteroidetes bacterium]|nr:MAG: hypothetical protein COB85_08210 [Bacteroidota bacterium]